MFKIIKIEETTTVMDYIKKYNTNTIVIANKQTQGRGKNTRTWISNKSKNLYMAISIDTKNKNINYFNYCFLSALAMVKSIEYLINKDINIKIKWPNDILLNNKKIGGILLENDLQKNLLVIGIGLNINNSPDLSNALFPPTDIEKEGFIIDKENLIDIFVNYFEKYSIDIIKNGFINVRKELLKYFYNLNNTITIKNNDEELTGIFADIDEDGTLILKYNDKIKKISSGDIF